MDTLIKASGLTKKYTVGRRELYALNNVSVQADEGTLTILRGRSGSGKTTLLNQLCLLDRPDSGGLLFDGDDFIRAGDSRRDACRRKNFGVIFQSLALMPHMTAAENVDFAMRVAGVGYRERRDRVPESLAVVGLSKRAAHMPSELSGGEQQRVAIARAIAHRPRVIFADEPTAELDTQTGFQVVKVFLDLIEKEKITVVMTTHNPALMELGHRVYTLEDGVIIEGL
ncbi:MAG: ABC transporter ATP-binding protein [Oscillospiraceae bacterium]|nr:ABC transporter ATP-binding protein [Oscillospiraceae bacterium]